MSTKPFVMGTEVEFSMSGDTTDRGESRLRTHQKLLDAIRSEHRWLQDARAASGVFLDNGSRYYLDYGLHNEFSSPEMHTPRQAAVYDRAAERILLRAKQAVMSQFPSENICITKHNRNIGMQRAITWGQHEAYTCWVSLNAAAKQMVPHLVSRIPYAGAGCLSEHPDGVGFELSQRARFMENVTGDATTHDRAIFCTRADKPSDRSKEGWVRTNLISKDSQRCSFGMYLTYGVTGLLFMIINDGHKIGQGLQLKDPVAAMQALSLDPELRKTVPLKNRKMVTALDVQRAYLKEARPLVESGEYPDWTYEVLEHWATTLDQLDNDPRSLSNRLDPYVKMAIFERQLNRARMSWSELRTALHTIVALQEMVPECVVRAIVNEDASGLPSELICVFRSAIKRAVPSRANYDHLRFSTRLQALELNYHELGGLFDDLLSAGLVNSVVVTEAEVEHATHHAPEGGRAAARAASINRLHGQSWCCDWHYLADRAEKHKIDLSDPFATDSQKPPRASVRTDRHLPT